LGPRLLVVLATGLGVGVLAGCGSKQASETDTSTTGVNAPIAATMLVHGTGKNTGAFVDPDSENKMGSDIGYVVMRLSEGHYRLTVKNTSPLGFINTFTWNAPANVTLTGLTTDANGHCALAGEQIACKGLALKPPSCTCKGDGGTAIVTFTAKQPKPKYGQHVGWEYSAMTIGSMTPVPYVIPSTPQEKPAANSDLPVCAKGQASTDANPCVYTG
jgi:hypothetical protein